MFAVGSEEEAKMLIVAACPMNIDGEYVARELAHEQTLENLEAFSTRLDEYHDRLVEAGCCDCT